MLKLQKKFGAHLCPLARDNVGVAQSRCRSRDDTLTAHSCTYSNACGHLRLDNIGPMPCPGSVATSNNFQHLQLPLAIAGLFDVLCNIACRLVMTERFDPARDAISLIKDCRVVQVFAQRTVRPHVCA